MIMMMMVKMLMIYDNDVDDMIMTLVVMMLTI